MIQIDKKTILVVFIAAVIVFALFKGCNKNDVLKKAEEDLKKSKEYSAIHEKKAQEFLAKNDSLELEKQIAQEKINFLENRNQEEKIKVLKLSRENIILKSNIEKYNTDELVTFFSKRYNSPKEVFKTDLGLVMKDSLSKKVATDLTDYDFVGDKLEIVQKVLNNEVSKSILKDTIINNLENQKKNINFAMNEKDLIIDNKDQLIESQLKAIKKETRKKQLLKVSVPIAIGLGIITGVLITK